MSIRFNRLALAAAALGLAIAGSALAPSSAEASPRHGGWGHHGPGGWGHHGGCTGYPRPVCGGGGYGGHWGHGGGWARPVGGYGPRCRFVERHNRWGEIVIRKVCFGPGWR